LNHFGVSKPGKLYDFYDVARVVSHENDSGRFNGDVCSGTYGNAQVGLRECRCVVYAVADHGHLITFGLKQFYLFGLFVRQNFREIFVNAEFFRNPRGNARRVPGNHGDFYSH